ncbi:glycosyltransferase family 9 protein [Halomonas sp. I5-271120]|uniref:glycosyltransferase family 9 protein n=1 Tax=Halomonas sp. I5-271120 TaxID=3061632 RepID=UPI002714C22A|nr:glycosyltransferase family 9 protein [Halomonas sp. I5-271120]
MTPLHDAPQGQRILVVRNDKLGDFMLAWPALASLKQAHAGNHISVLVPEYTAPLARQCPWIDEVILDPGDSGDRHAQAQLLARMRKGNFKALLTLYSTPRIGWLGWRSGIPMRLAPATKWAQIFYHHRITQRRSRSQKPEYQYNLDLAEALLIRLGQPVPAALAPPYWPLPQDERRRQRQHLKDELDLMTERSWAFLHAGSGGSAVNLTLEQYASLAGKVDARLTEAQAAAPLWLLTCGPGEEDTATALCKRLTDQDSDAVFVPPRQGLTDFALSLAAADLFIAGSTGPLHIAGCLDLPTVGFYPSKRSATPLRWQTCNRERHRLAFCPPADAGSDTDMSRIDLDVAAAEISQFLDRRKAQSFES